MKGKGLSETTFKTNRSRHIVYQNGLLCPNTMSKVGHVNYFYITQQKGIFLPTQSVNDQAFMLALRIQGRHPMNFNQSLHHFDRS